VPFVLKCGNLKLLEPSGPVQACNGIALFLPFFLWNVFVDFKYLYEQTVIVYRVIGLHAVGDIIVT
jgi:hypothetical protein